VSRALVIVGKAPTPGSTKTRLSPPLSPEQAAELYSGFLQDTVGLALGLGWDRVTLVYPPRPGAEQLLQALLPKTVCLLPQPGEGLGAALAGAFQHHLADGFTQVVLIGSDNPTLPGPLIESALRGLAEYDLVIGPSSDGGYYLVGMGQPHLGIFERITWSTDVVFQETLDRAVELGLSVFSVAEWYDVDSVAELYRLRNELAGLPPGTAPATRRVLAKLSW
jgi:rSAM/selenodomain-associated transferase 1